jgi:hypothetical protein
MSIDSQEPVFSVSSSSRSTRVSTLYNHPNHANESDHHPPKSKMELLSQIHQLHAQRCTAGLQTTAFGQNLTQCLLFPYGTGRARLLDKSGITIMLDGLERSSTGSAM